MVSVTKLELQPELWAKIDSAGQISPLKPRGVLAPDDLGWTK